MRSSLPKVLQPIAGRPMLGQVISAAAPLSPSAMVVVIAEEMKAVEEAAQRFFPAAQFATQSQQLGTGHAVCCALPALPDSGSVLVLYGDTPLITSETLHRFISEHEAQQATISLLAMKLSNPTGYGRVVMREAPWVDSIVEEKDASNEQKRIEWVWGGVMVFDAAFLAKELPNIAPSPATGEIYLTSLLEVAAKQNKRSLMIEISAQEVMGVNDKQQLAEAEAVMQQRLRQQAMQSGVTMIAPETVFLQADTQFEADVVVHPFVVFGAGVKVGRGAEIRSYSHIEKAVIERGAVVGPYARLRPGAVIGEEAHVGNFVEIKNSRLGKGAKANHLSYIGDSEVGEAANIGAGTITCNYDGFEKHKTIIGSGSFIGSNSALVAPVSIGRDAMVAAGSVITSDVPDDALAIARPQQHNKAAKARDIRQKKKKNT